jgi:hypothetical protein
VRWCRFWWRLKNRHKSSSLCREWQCARGECSLGAHGVTTLICELVVKVQLTKKNLSSKLQVVAKKNSTPPQAICQKLYYYVYCTRIDRVLFLKRFPVAPLCGRSFTFQPLSTPAIVGAALIYTERIRANWQIISFVKEMMRHASEFQTRRRFFQLLFLCCHIIAGRGLVQSLHIAPATVVAPNVTTEDSAAFSFIDTVGFGPGTDFYQLEKLDIQLYPELPVWTVYNLRTSSTHFVGESEDATISCDLIRWETTKQSVTIFSIVTGRVHDRANDIYYEIKPNAMGQDIVSRKAGRDIFYNHEPIQVSWRDVILSEFSLTSWLKDHVWPLTRLYYRDEEEKDEDTTVIDVMVVWTENGECQRSFLPSGCDLTAQTKANMKAAIHFMVEDANVVHANSDTGVVLRLAHMQRDTSGFREGGVFDIVLRALVRLPYIISMRYVGVCVFHGMQLGESFGSSSS